MQRETLSRRHLLLLFIASSIPRIVGALWLPNAFGDAYAYTEQIYYLRRALLNGSFSLSNLFGFWLPLYQLICAGVSTVAGSPFYVPKLVSAFCGGGLCVVVCLLTWELTSSRRLSWLTASVVALNPYHVLFSSSAMTDVPHAFFILLCGYCCIRERWLLASIFAVAAGLMRIESWTLIPIIPLAQFLRHSNPSFQTLPERRLSGTRTLLKSILLGLLLTAGPVFWLYVSWKATGSAWKYFEIRNNYIVETLTTNPWLTHYSLARLALDFVRLVYTCNPLVIYAALALLVVILKHNVSAPRLLYPLLTKPVLGLQNLLTGTAGLLLVVFCSHLAFLLLAYFTGNQPEIWPRYGLIFFTLGLPLVAFLWRLTGIKSTSPTATADSCRSARGLTCRGVHPRAPITRSQLGETGAAMECRRYKLGYPFPGRPFCLYVTALIFAVQFCVQLVDVTRMTVASDPNVIAAQFLEDQRRVDHSTGIYCEDGAIRVLSGIPLEQFRDQYNSPADDDGFLQSLKDHEVRFLIYKDLPGSRLKEMITRLRAGRRTNGITLEEVIPQPRKKPKETIIVYRVHAAELAKASKHER